MPTNLTDTTIILTVSESKLKEGFSQECHMACACAHSQIVEVYKHIESGTVTVSELQKIDAHKDQMKQLCEAAAVHSNKKETQSALDQRLQEVRKFGQQKMYLSHLYNHILHKIRGKAFSALKMTVSLIVCDLFAIRLSSSQRRTSAKP